jgi:hypothetical protein
MATLSLQTQLVHTHNFPDVQRVTGPSTGMHVNAHAERLTSINVIGLDVLLREGATCLG